MTLSPLKTGLMCRCPSCGKGALYAGYIKVRSECSSCDASFEKIVSDDAPAFFVMMTVGFIVVFAAVYVELNYRPNYWIHAVLWLPLTVLLTLLSLPLVKSLLISLQFRHDTREGRSVPPDHKTHDS